MFVAPVGFDSHSLRIFNQLNLEKKGGNEMRKRITILISMEFVVIIVEDIMTMADWTA